MIPTRKSLNRNNALRFISIFDYIIESKKDVLIPWDKVPELSPTTMGHRINEALRYLCFYKIDEGKHSTEQYQALRGRVKFSMRAEGIFINSVRINTVSKITKLKISDAIDTLQAEMAQISQLSDLEKSLEINETSEVVESEQNLLAEQPQQVARPSRLFEDVIDFLSSSTPVFIQEGIYLSAVEQENLTSMLKNSPAFDGEFEITLTSVKIIK